MNLKLGQALLSLQNSKLTDIPESATQLLSSIKDELKRINEQIKKLNDQMKGDQGEQSPELQPFRKAKIALLFDQIYRIKRFLMIYHNFRCERIEDQFWYYGGQVNNSQKHNLTEPERNYFNSYKGLVTEYVEEVGVDLTIDLDPPFDSEVEILVKEDCGELVTESGDIIKLQKNARLFTNRKVIEPLVKQGLVVISKRK